MRILPFKKVYMIHGKQRLEWLWVFQPWILSWNAGVLADLDPARFGTPPPPPPTKLSENIILNVLVKMVDTLRSSAY